MYFAFLMLGQAAMASPASEVIAAYADCLRLDAETARQTRYLTCYNWTAAQRVMYLRDLMPVHVNHLSREGRLKAPRQVTPTLLAICADDYGWELTTYGALHENEPYFHVKIRTGETVETAHAPWLPTKEIVLLSKMTNSLVPILRMDWWVWATSQPKAYYKFLGITKISDLEKAVGLDRKLIEAKLKDLQAVPEESIVTKHARLLVRQQSSMGAWWESRDNRDPTGTGNPRRHFDKDYTFAAREFYVTLPNGLFAKALASDKDDLQNEAPPDIASDGTTRSPDRRVICPRCDICHGGMLKVPDDYIRGTLTGGLGIGVPVDRAKAKRLEAILYGPFYEELAADNAKLTATMKRLGTTPAAYSKAYADAYYGYEASVTNEVVAAEYGLSKAAFVERLKTYFAIKGLSDLGLAPFVRDKPIQRSHIEEMTPLLAGILYGANP